MKIYGHQMLAMLLTDLEKREIVMSKNRVGQSEKYTRI